MPSADFPPVEHRVERPPALRQSLLDRLDRCPRSFYLSLKNEGGVQSHAMARGTAFHAMAETATALMIQNGETSMDPAMCRDLMEQIIRERTDLVLPVYEQDALRAMAWNWGKATKIGLGNVAVVEERAGLKVGDWIVNGTIDLGYTAGDLGVVVDYKTSMSMPRQQTFERQFQGQFYGLLMAEGRYLTDDGEWGARLSTEPIKRVRVVQVYPRFYFEDTDQLAARVVEYDVGDLVDFRVSLVSLLQRADHGFDTGNWPAVPGTHCATCPAAQECPIPEQYRAIKTIEDEDDAERMAQRWDQLVAEANRLKATLRAHADKTGKPIPIGSDVELGFFPVKSKPMKESGKQKLSEGQPLTTDDFSDRTSTRFEKRVVKDEEGTEE